MLRLRPEGHNGESEGLLDRKPASLCLRLKPERIAKCPECFETGDPTLNNNFACVWASLSETLTVLKTAARLALKLGLPPPMTLAFG